MTIAADLPVPTDLNAMPALSERARRVISGLCRTGRASRTGRPAVTAGGHVVLRRLGRSGVYLVALTGEAVLAGEHVVDAEPLQGGFVECMAAAGA